MNIKYDFSKLQQSNTPFSDVHLFKEEGISHEGGLYPWTTKGKDSADIFDKNIRLINSRINGIKKQLSYWDLYKITTQVTNPSNLDSTYAGLVPGQACVINCTSFTNNGITYRKGDVVVKMLDENAAYIPTVSTGVYYPSKIYQNVTDPDKPDGYNYYFYWQGTEIWEEGWYYCSKDNAEDVLDNNGEVKTGELLHKEEQIYQKDPNINLEYQYTTKVLKDQEVKVFKVPQSEKDESFIYGIYEKVISNYSFDTAKFNDFVGPDEEDKIIRPTIKFFTSENEEIWLTFTVALNEDQTKWIVSFTDGLPSVDVYIQVK